MEFKSALETANAQLAARGSRLRIEQRGRRLNLRGSLPLRGDPSQSGLQRISLGLMADPAGLNQALSTAALVQLQLEQRSFDWTLWSAPTSPTKAKGRSISIQTAIESFEAAFFADPRRRRSPASSRTTWTSA